MNEEKEAERIKPCPFCVSIATEAFESHDWYAVSCKECDAIGPGLETEKEAIEAWNKAPRIDCDPDCPHAGRPWWNQKYQKYKNL